MADETTNDSTMRDNVEQPAAHVLPAGSKLWGKVKLVGTILAIGVVVIALLLPAQRSAPEAGRRMTCQKNTREVGLGSHYFNSRDIDFGSDQNVVETGAPNRKWRKLISFTTSNELDDPYRRMKRDKPRPSPEF
jgi:hypothetical protein